MKKSLGGGVNLPHLNWNTVKLIKKRAKSGGGFRRRELFKCFVSLLVIVLLFPMKVRKF